MSYLGTDPLRGVTVSQAAEWGARAAGHCWSAVLCSASKVMLGVYGVRFPGKQERSHGQQLCVRVSDRQSKGGPCCTNRLHTPLGVSGPSGQAPVPPWARPSLRGSRHHHSASSLGAGTLPPPDVTSIVSKRSPGPRASHVPGKTVLPTTCKSSLASTRNSEFTARPGSGTG